MVLASLAQAQTFCASAYNRSVRYTLIAQSVDTTMTPSSKHEDHQYQILDPEDLSTKSKIATYLNPGPLKYAISRGSANLIMEVFPPFLVAGLGMVAAGLLLGHVVKEWPAFEEVKEIMVLVPALLGLKGNLEMTLASRLGTHANMGDLDCSIKDFWRGGTFTRIIVGNLAVVQSQAIVVGFLASLVAITVNFASNDTWNPAHALLLCSSAIAAASLASLILASIMIGVVFAARRCNINPDNVASPIAGMLGDFCTLALLSGIAQALWSTHEEFAWVQWVIIVSYCLVAPVCGLIAHRNHYTSDVLRQGWTPVVLAMLGSSIGGIVLKHSVSVFKQLAPFAPVMNGAGGNLAAVHASRLSTDVHTSRMTSPESPKSPKKLVSPGGRGGESSDNETTKPDVPTPSTASSTPRDDSDIPQLASEPSPRQAARILISLVVPGAICFSTLIVGMRSGWKHVPTLAFVFLFALAALTQVCILVGVADHLVPWLYARGVDPDNAAIPYVTSLGDVIGTVVLFSAFAALQLVGGEPWPGCYAVVVS